MEDYILESIFLDHTLWSDALEHGVCKGMHQKDLMYVQSPHGRAELCRSIGYGEYSIAPPRTGYRKKDDGGERTFYANTGIDRILLHVIYKWLNRNEAKMIHPSCLSYQEGIGIGKIVKDFSHRVTELAYNDQTVVGRIFDIHKYFESVDRGCIHRAFDAVEQDYGKSVIIDLLRKYYDSDIYYDTRKKEYQESYSGLKQGCAVSSWLANVILFPLDEELSNRGGLYVRYSDDIVYVGSDYEDVTTIIKTYLRRIGLVLNERKIEDISPVKFVRFLGYNIRGGEITLSQKWVRNFQKNIDRLTIHNLQLIRKVRSIRRKTDVNTEKDLIRLMKNTERSVARFLYYGDGKFSWASHVLGIVNKQEDLTQLNLYCLDALRAVYTGKTSIGGLGFVQGQGITRGKGRHVTSNRISTSHLEREDRLNGYCSMLAMNKVISNRWLYRALVAELLQEKDIELYPNKDRHQELDSERLICELETRYHRYLDSQPDGKTIDRYYARPLETMSPEELLFGENRKTARQELEHLIKDKINFSMLQKDDDKWYWQSEKFPELVILKSWFHV